MASSDEILTRIQRELGVPDLVDRLVGGISPTDLQSLMLEVYRRRAADVDVSHLMRQFSEGRFVRPSPVDARLLGALEVLAFARLPAGFERIELSPLCPLGTIACVTGADQHKIVSTARNSEVVSDSTNVMALECARRRRELLRARDTRGRVRLASSHRLVRAQALPGANSWAHFRALALCTAGRDEGSFRFETEALGEQLRFWLAFVRATAEVGVPLTEPRLLVRRFGEDRLQAALEHEVFDPLRREHAELRIEPDPDVDRARGYYEGVAVRLLARRAAGSETELLDAGFTGWTARLTGDRKERLLISGLGLERLAVPAPG